MNAVHDYIQNKLKPLTLNSEFDQILNLIEDYQLTHLPIVHDGVFLGCISQEDILGLDADKTLQEYRHLLTVFFARDHFNWLDVLQLFTNNQANLLPVLDKENQYIGYIELSDAFDVFSHASFLKEPGGVVVIQKPINQYSASEIVQIVESNNLRLLGLFVWEMTSHVQVYLKVNAESLNDLLQTFRRYEYEIISDHAEDLYLQSLKERLDYIDRFLNI